MTLGFIVGKFYPPHRGHKHLIETARSQCDQLIVVIAHHPSQQIPGELRRDWLAEIHPDCDIRLVSDELENDSEQWAKWTLNYLGRAPDIVFTSESYGPTYAQLMASRHVMVDLLRSAIPISATMIRDDPLAHFSMLEPCVRAHFVRRVVIAGAESTGKTTLAAELANYFQTSWVAEFGREYWEAKAANWAVEMPGWTSAEFITIAAEQQRRENLAAREANRVLFCDTNAFVTGTWYERYLGQRSAEVDAIGQLDRAHLYLLADIDVPFVQDGWRDGEAIRQWMHQRFYDQLLEQRSPFIVLSGSWDVRRAKAIAAVESFLASSRKTLE